ncbi:MAG: EcsC family protein [Vallitaleaceae bacterium]|nr:EcsC family protein [Vallitaleaceae bacterium]
MDDYEKLVRNELHLWKLEMLRKPAMTSRVAKGLQNKMNAIIPDKAHQIITQSIKQMVRAVLFGSEKITSEPLKNRSLKIRDLKAKEKIDLYKKIAMASGWGTGAGGLFLGMADFPILLSIKMKFLYEIAAIYGYDVSAYKERLFVLYVFQLAFSSQEKRKPVYEIITHWEDYQKTLPDHEDVFDWKTFQQEYRDYIDVAKMLQLVPVIGAAVGAYTNAKLLRQLGHVAMQAYRHRILG